ncbi:hypothetical protein [Rhizohabitans arisaemae]|uniref:hypothetical protein n=1 Tax=Rhizohabitans arisaemae TaxID=2720610 RepID=UPI0024B09A7E|nr:hypothetical protein [Rhizohabitans arisaemae]
MSDQDDALTRYRRFLERVPTAYTRRGADLESLRVLVARYPEEAKELLERLGYLAGGDRRSEAAETRSGDPPDEGPP